MTNMETPSNTTKALEPKKMDREARRPFGSTVQKLAYETRAGYHRHWFNEDPGRLDDALAAGYKFVMGKDAKKVTRIVGVTAGGGPLSAYLMEIPQEWYNEDMAKQQATIDEMDTAIKQGAAGRVPGDGRYVPADRGISIREGKK